MLSFPPSVRIFLCVQPADMRRSFDRPAAMGNEVLRQDPLSGHLFVLRNRPGDRIRLLSRDTDGYAIWYKRLEEGTFRFPGNLVEGAEVDAVTLAMILKGLDLSPVERHRRYARPPFLRVTVISGHSGTMPSPAGVTVSEDAGRVVSCLPVCG